MSDEPFVRMLSCEIHGSRRWKLHIMCVECGRVFQCADPRKARFAAATCPCGARLAPPGDPKERVGDWLGKRGVEALIIGDIESPAASAGLDAIAAVDGVRDRMNACHDTSDWSARPICYVCFRRIARDMNGRIPNYHKPPGDN